MKKVVISLCFVLSLFISNHSYGQSEVPEKNIVSFSILGTSSYFGVTYERMLTDKWAAEIGVGILSVGFGATYYPWSIKEDDVSFYTGLKFNSPNVIDALLLFPDDLDPNFYIPIGFTYASSSGFNLGIDVGPSLNGSTSVFGNIRLGFRF